jgi:hypothetical protein
VFVKKNVNQRSEIYHREFFSDRHPSGGFHHNHPHHYLFPDSDRHYHASSAFDFSQRPHPDNGPHDPNYPDYEIYSNPWMYTNNGAKSSLNDMSLNIF